MFRHALGVALFVTLASCQSMPGMAGEEMMKMNETAELLAKFRNASVAQSADSNRDGRINTDELAQALYRQADRNNDQRVTLAEFLDSFRSRMDFLPSPVLVKMFLLLDDVNDDLPAPANATPSCNPQENIFSNVQHLGDRVLQQNDVSLQVFTQSNNPSVQEFQTALNVWVEEAAKRAEKATSMPFKVAQPYDKDFDYELFFRHLDADSNDIIDKSELTALMQRFSTSGNVDRSSWASGNNETYGQDLVVATVLFDSLDKNNDLVLNGQDVDAIMEMADANHDDRTTKQEMYRLIQKKNNYVRRMLGYPIKTVMYDCPDLVGKDSDDCESGVDATLVTMDMDYNMDGNITEQEMRHGLSSMDEDMNGKVDRIEYIHFVNMRYRQDMAEADLEFDAMDENGDGYLTWEDAKSKNDSQQWLCACDYRMHVQSSAFAAKHLAKERKSKMDSVRMMYHLAMWAAEKKAHESQPGPVKTWTWETTSGKPAMGACRACNAKENWGMSGDQQEEGMMENHYDLVKVVMEAMKMLKEHMGDKMQNSSKDSGMGQGDEDKNTTSDWPKMMGWGQQKEEKNGMKKMLEMVMHLMKTMEEEKKKEGGEEMGMESVVKMLGEWMEKMEKEKMEKEEKKEEEGEEMGMEAIKKMLGEWMEKMEKEMKEKKEKEAEKEEKEPMDMLKEMLKKMYTEKMEKEEKEKEAEKAWPKPMGWGMDKKQEKEPMEMLKEMMEKMHKEMMEKKEKEAKKEPMEMLKEMMEKMHKEKMEEKEEKEAEAEKEPMEMLKEMMEKMHKEKMEEKEEKEAEKEPMELFKEMMEKMHKEKMEEKEEKEAEKEPMEMLKEMMEKMHKEKMEKEQMEKKMEMFKEWMEKMKMEKMEKMEKEKMETEKTQNWPKPMGWGQPKPEKGVMEMLHEYMEKMEKEKMEKEKEEKAQDSGMQWKLW